MRIIIASPEAVPYVKTGGLADVAGALLKEFRKRGEKATLILPLYGAIRKNFRLHRTGRSFTLKMGDNLLSAEIWSSDRSSDPAAYFIECDQFYDRPELYGTALGDYHDNALRFAFFSRAVLETCLVLNISPDVIHCNDWQTGLLPLYLKDFYREHSNLSDTASVFTIHNLGYQGLFDKREIGNTGLGWDYFTAGKVEFHDKLNYMKTGIVYSDLISTVSGTYAREILRPENGFGLDGLLSKRKHELYGIINGIDYDEFDPSRDSFLPEKYQRNNLKGRMHCKKMLVRDAGLMNDGRPVIGFVGRFASQKGLDLVAGAMDQLVSMGLQIVMLGRGEDDYQKMFTGFAEQFRGRVSVKIGFEERYARLIYAGADFFLMPSKYEPCGLGQLIALRYGAVPVARRTGGLADTITDYDDEASGGTGFLFSDYSVSAMVDAVRRGLNVFADRAKFRKLLHDAMSADFSWASAADRYILLYKKAGRKVTR
jgi:starch synthase